jgi:hypothetical protein
LFACVAAQARENRRCSWIYAPTLYEKASYAGKGYGRKKVFDVEIDYDPLAHMALSVRCDIPMKGKAVSSIVRSIHDT